MTAHLRDRHCSATEVAQHFLRLIQKDDGLVNAWITVDEEQVLNRARYLDAEFEKLSTLPLYGVPVGIKDLTVTAGLRTTFGSTLFSDNIPRADAVAVERLRNSGAIIMGKTNTPEFGVGCHTVNNVAGATRNPWDTSRTVGGSSGGSAAALAAGMCTLAEGTDFGGSLRVPAAYCGVVALRTGAGMIPHAPQPMLWDSYYVTGPMARSVDDLEVMLRVMRGPHIAAPMSLTYHEDARQLSAHPRVAVSCGRDLIDVHPDVESSVRWAADRLEAAGCRVSEGSPDLSTTQAITQTLRAVRAAGLYGDLLAAHRDVLHPGLVEDIERGLRLPITAAIQAEKQRSDIYAATAGFWDDYDVLVLPTVPMPPFGADEQAPLRVGKDVFDSYSGWMVLVTAITLMGWPAMAVPSLPSPSGYPLGIQLIAPQGRESQLIELARRFEHVASWRERFPPPSAPTDNSWASCMSL